MSDVRQDITDLLTLADEHARISREAAGAAGRLLAELHQSCTGAVEWRTQLRELGITPDRARILMLAARTST